MRFFLILFIILPLITRAQKLQKLVQLPDELNEISGILSPNGTKIYAINDSGNEAELLIYDTFSGDIQRVVIAQAKNVDWEELAQDDSGNVFIGDVGNNLNTRKEFIIYKVSNPDLRNEDTLTAEEIKFTYGDQTEFPPPANRLIYDCEAMIWLNDSIFLFTKNRTNPYNGMCYVYALPARPGTYEAELKDSVYLGGSIKELSWIAAADYKNGELALLGYNTLHLFSAFNGADFFSGEYVSYNLGGITQKESICFIPELPSTFYIADEKYIGGPNLYVFSLQSGRVERYKNPFDVKLKPRCFEVKDCAGICEVEVFHLNGQRVFTKTFSGSLQIKGDTLGKGYQVVKLKNDKNTFTYKWLIR
jgi:hypothetical protein